jgi:hypothetical protein
VSSLTSAPQVEATPEPRTDSAPDAEELDLLFERMRRRLYAKRAELLALLAELTADEPHA